MRKIILLLLAAFSAGCSSDDDSSGGVPLGSCTNDGQKQFVLDAMRQWYFWEDRLPATVDISQFANPDDLLDFLTTFSPDDGTGSPVDRFSFINSAVADQQFFGEGKFEGFGFNFRFFFFPPFPSDIFLHPPKINPKSPDLGRVRRA